MDFTEAVIVALVTGVVTLGGAWWRFRADLRKSAQEEMATNATARLELERLLMARVGQLQKHLQENEEDLKTTRMDLKATQAELDETREEVATLREENAALRGRVRDLETENAALRAELKRICGASAVGAG